MAKLVAKDKLGKNKQIGALQTRMQKQLGVYSVFQDLDPELQKRLPEAVEYADFRRVENERQLEAIKSVMAGYMFNENVVVSGEVPDGKGGVRTVALSQFDVMMKATTVFLTAMNIQNKIWGLYNVPESTKSGEPPTGLNIKNLAAGIVQDMQRIARKERLALPASGPRTANHSAPDPDLRGKVAG